MTASELAFLIVMSHWSTSGRASAPVSLRRYPVAKHILEMEWDKSRPVSRAEPALGQSCELVRRAVTERADKWPRARKEQSSSYHVHLADEFLIPHQRRCSMTRLAYTSILLALMTSVASAQVPAPAPATRATPGPAAQIHSTLPADSVTVTHWYKQNVYDPSDNKIGEIMDVLVDRDGRVSALIIGVGGFLGMGEKDVAVPFNAVKATTKDNNKYYLVMNSTKNSLKSAKGFKYDRNAMTWMPEDAPATTGTPAAAPRQPNR